MAPNVENAQPGATQKTLHVWSKPIEQPDESQSLGGDKTTNNARPTIADAVGMIKTEDFTNVHNTPCARQGFLAGIAAGAGVGGLRFVLRGKEHPSFQSRSPARDALTILLCRQCRQGGELGCRDVYTRKHGIVRVLSIPPTSRADTNEASHRSSVRK